MRLTSFIFLLKIVIVALQPILGLAEENLDKKVYEIEALKNQWAAFVYEEYEKFPDFFSKLQSTLEEGFIERVEDGDGGTYFIKDKKGVPLFVVKPVDESINCLNNPKQTRYPLPEILARDPIPLYQSAQREALCYELAVLCGVEAITPETHLAILSSPEFFLFSPHGSFEKLCSVAKYLPNTLSLCSLLQTLFSLHLKDEDLESYFCEEDFALINLFIWLTYDTDAHAGNILAYPKTFDAKVFTVYGLKKIDNSLCFPEKNTDFFHFLMHFPLAKKTLSPLIREKILNLPLQEIEKSLEKFTLLSTLSAFKQRVYLLQNLIQRPFISYYEVSLRLLLLEKNQGLDLALSLRSVEDLEKLFPSFL